MKYSKYISLISTTGDLIILNLCFNLAFWYLHAIRLHNLNSIVIIFFFFINIAWIVSANIFEAYKIDHQSYKKVILFNNTKTIVFFFFLFLLFFQVFTFNYYSRDEIKYLFVIFFALLLAWKFFLYYTFLFYRKLGYNYRNVVIVGYNDMATELKDYFVNNAWTGYRFKGFLTHQQSGKKDIVGTYHDLENFIISNRIDEIYIMTSDLNKSLHKIISSIIGKYPITIRLVPDLSTFSYRNLDLVSYDMVPVMRIQQGPLDYWHNRSIKRLMDIILSVMMITFVLSWLAPILFILDIISDRAGVFFLQPRSGINNKQFMLFKFRTMKKNGEAHIQQATENDDRLTKIGKFLRKTSIDEFPQFFNVLIGNMSVIGPRPHMLKHTEEYKFLVEKFMIRHSIKPGITGYAQVRGFRGEIKRVKDMKQRIKLDVFYIENWSIWLDIKIILITIGKLIKGDEKAY
ncbi:MAG: undecaprenyl-phosphate glucose phosphotransferase [Bacteroidetes bacterium CG_4_9_14_3_um_filter_41_19]|nr:MAG: undecaprenyl-phosphate glucose phosphotransferase [Bacteroidetes bacterium CG_4_9_14_3_um_filter_41_19]